MNSVHPLGNTLLRTPETFAKYQENPNRKEEECFICEAGTYTCYRYWKLIANDFPYDAVADIHHMLVPRRHISHSNELDRDELRELEELKMIFGEKFDAIVENLQRGRTFLSHYHLHLIQWKRA